MQARPTLDSEFPVSLRRVFAALCVVIALAGFTTAQTVPTGVQEYFVLGWEQHMWDMMDRVVDAEGSGPLQSGMNSVVTATASATGQVLYYDHWEDGIDTGLVDFPDTIGVLQATTRVLGDGVPGNGDVCTYNANIACGTDLLAVGDYVNFNSDQGLGAGCASLPESPTNARSRSTAGVPRTRAQSPKYVTTAVTWSRPPAVLCR